ncbi:MAG: hypothetical protein NTX37_09745 [Burkholderiales bacterium]|jgi:tetratricopeptide (TPR) repeat protein|nr:hypothetical protein [Burkholderiales bacterium]
MKHASRAFATRTARNVVVTLCLGLVLSACDLLANAEKLKADASAALASRNFATAVQTAKKWTEKAPEQYEAYFVLAQAQAQAGDRNAALVALEQALKTGLKDDVQIDSNVNLEPIKSMVAYKDLMKIHFPGRESKKEEEQDSGSVSITEKEGMQVLRAGDIVLKVPALK